MKTDNLLFEFRFVILWQNESSFLQLREVDLAVTNLVYHNTGTLLTGDISLSDNAKYKKLIDHYSTELENVGIFLLPHHGSRHSWNESIIQDFFNTSYIVSFGRKNKYGHPSGAVVSDLVYCKKICIFAMRCMVWNILFLI
mgnify:CR=1 FL=1